MNKSPFFEKMGWARALTAFLQKENSTRLHSKVARMFHFVAAQYFGRGVSRACTKSRGSTGLEEMTRAQVAGDLYPRICAPVFGRLFVLCALGPRVLSTPSRGWPIVATGNPKTIRK